MPKKPLKILGINPGSRYLGFALFGGGELLDWGIKVVKGSQSRKKTKKILRAVSDLIELHEPDALSIKKLHPSRSSRNLEKIVSEIACLAKSKRLRLRRYAIGELESFFCPGEKKNKRRLIKQVAAAYPDLYHELEKEKRLKNPYHFRMFEAAALAAICFQQLDK